jgi:hypothetical protein
MAGGTWQGTVVAPTYGGVGANTVAMTGYPFMTLGVVSQDAVLTKYSTTGIQVNNGANNIQIWHDGANANFKTSIGGLIVDSGDSATPAYIELSDDDTNVVKIVSQEMAADWTFTLPAAVPGANNTPLVGSTAGTLSWGTDFATATTIGTAYIYRVGGTDVSVADGGTGASTYALNGVLYGNAGSAIGVTAIGAEGQILRVGASPFVPAWTTATFPTTAGNAGNALISDGTNWASGAVLSAVPTGLTYTTATRALSLTANYFIPDNTWVGQSAITTVGTVTTGTWNALKKILPVNSGNNATVDLTAAGTCYGQIYTNAANDSDTHYDLPAAVVGMSMTFFVTDAFTITVDPNLNDRIIGTSANGDYLQGAATIGNMLTLVCVKTGEWQTVGKNGTWTEE